MNTVDLKKQYARNHGVQSETSLYLNQRLLNTYDRISIKTIGQKLGGTNVDLGCGDKAFSAVCEQNNIQSFAYDYPEFNLECDSLKQEDASVDFVTMNAVIEHINKPDHILAEIKRVLKTNGLVFIRTPNWKIDFKNFYNDPTHINPYTPKKMEFTLELAGLKCIFNEPGLIEKKWFWWRLPEFLKWNVAKLIQTKSILSVGMNIA